MRGLADKVAVVTGAGHGIGAATVRRFLDEGMRVAAADLDAAALAEVFRDVPADRHLFLAGDCTDAGLLADLHARTLATLGPVDVLFNNVGQSARERASAFHQSDEATWRFVLEVSLMTAMRASRLVAPARHSGASGACDPALMGAR